MLSMLFGIYSGILLVTYISTVLLIIFRRNWGPLPLYYIKIVEFLQSRLSGNSCVNDDLNNNDSDIVIGRSHLTPSSVHHRGNPFEVSTNLLSSGIESILQDDVTRPFLESPQRRWRMMSFPPETTPNLLLVYALSITFRWGFLFPLRVLLLLSSFLFIIATGVLVNIFPISQKTTLYFGLTFAKMYNAAVGIVIKSHNEQFRPKTSGIAVANHLTANDVMHLYADCDYDGIGYTVTGQSHGGVLRMMEKFGSKLTPCLWLDREDPRQRSSFQKSVIDYASRKNVFPVLLFPEGYCTNNTSLLQFRKAVFTGEVPIYPIAIVQNARVGDAFWREDTFFPYLLRIMTSFAQQYDVFYMPAMEKRPTEDSVAFAGRVQSAIASKIGCSTLPFDGGLKKMKNRILFRTRIQESISKELVAS